MAALLLEKGADPDRMSLNYNNRDIMKTGIFTLAGRFSRGSTPGDYVPVYSPLMYAAFKGNGEAIKLLLKAGADVNARGVSGMTALMAAAGRNRSSALSNMAISPGRAKQAAVVKNLLEAGADPNLRISNTERDRVLEPDGATALWLAASFGAGDAARLLLEKGADPSIKAECRARSAEPGEDYCDCRRIAELRGHHGIVSLIDRFTPAEKEEK